LWRPAERELLGPVLLERLAVLVLDRVARQRLPTDARLVRQLPAVGRGDDVGHVRRDLDPPGDRPTIPADLHLRRLPGVDDDVAPLAGSEIGQLAVDADL